MDTNPSPYRDVWAEAPDGQSLAALINGEVGWLVYFRYDGDPGFSSRDPDFGGPPDEMVEYRLDNGQHDHCPRAWAYSTPVVERALEHFRVHNEPPPFISWHNDSGDGMTLGSAG